MAAEKNTEFFLTGFLVNLPSYQNLTTLISNKMFQKRSRTCRTPNRQATKSKPTSLFVSSQPDARHKRQRF